MNESVASSLTAASHTPSDMKFTQYLYGIASVICRKNLPGNIVLERFLCFSVSEGQMAFISSPLWFFFPATCKQNCI